MPGAEAAASRTLEHDLVDETPLPIFTGLKRLNDRMSGFAKVFGRVFVLRGIAAADVSAFEAHAQMNPLVAGLEAFLATGCARLNVVYVVEMRALHHGVPSLRRGGIGLGTRPALSRKET